MERLRRIIGPAVMVVALLAPSIAIAQGGSGPQRFAFIDSRVILQRAPGSAAAQAQFTRERDGMLAEAQQLQDSLAAMITAYQRDQATLTAAQKDQREKTLRDRQVDFDQRMGQLDQAVQQRQFELVQPIMNQIRDVIESIRNEEGYLFIFDVAAESGIIVAADKNLDITERVIARLKPIPVSVTRTDTSKTPAAAKPAPAGITRPPVIPPSR